MPIKPENRHHYGPEWRAISKRIREVRAGNKCEQCKAPNGEPIERGDGRNADTYRLLATGEVFNADGESLGYARGDEYDTAKRPIVVVLTVAHLNHDPSDNREENLKALCQQCHLRHDKDQHAESARTTRRARKVARELFT
jgi:hypothetical protein